jgi:predicted nucleic acid-binding protein
MKRYVVDASVAIKWYVPEIWAESADHVTADERLVNALSHAPLAEHICLARQLGEGQSQRMTPVGPRGVPAQLPISSV